jgi:hypothetical protein
MRSADGDTKAGEPGEGDVQHVLAGRNAGNAEPSRGIAENGSN